MHHYISSSQNSSLHFHSSLNHDVRIPRLESRDLNGNDWLLPHDLPAKKTLLLFAFKREQQSSIDSWVNALGLRSPENKIPWLEIPLIQKPWKLLSSWIDNGMKRGIEDHNLRSHVWTIYTNRSSFLKTMKLSSIQSIFICVAHRDGSVAALVSGDYTSAAAQIILKALEN